MPHPHQVKQNDNRITLAEYAQTSNRTKLLITCQFLTRDNNGNNEYEYSNGIIMQNKFDKMSDLQTSIKAM